MNTRHVLAQILAVVVFVTPALAESWDRFRGPNGSGVASEGALPDAVVAEAARWRTELASGFSSPVVGDACVFVTGGEGLRTFTYCIDPGSGAIRWQRESPAPLERPSKGPNSTASSTPATDGANVVVFFENFGLVSYDSEGSERWHHPLGPFTTPYGMGSSPIWVDGLVVMQCDQDVGSFLLAVDGNTGKEAWRVDRPRATHGFATPVVRRPADGPGELIVSGSYEVVGYDLRTGERRWWVNGMAWQAKSGPVLTDDTLYVHSWMASPSELGVPTITTPWSDALGAHDADGNGTLAKSEAAEALGLSEIWFLYDLDQDGVLDTEEWNFVLARSSATNGLFAIRLGGEGNLTDSHVLWRHDKSLPNIPSPLLWNDVLYVLKEGGILTSLDADSGEVLKRARIEGAEDPYFASPIAADGRILTASKDGKVAILEAGREWETLSLSDFGEEIWSTPALANGMLYVRTQKALYAFAQE